MPDRRLHRGPHPDDAELFAPAAWPALRLATAELSWLLSRGYSPTAALKLVGDRHRLGARQRNAVERCACADAAGGRRRAHGVAAAALRGQSLWIDGYNVLTSLEAALAGGVILHARDGCYRDLASMHGTYRRVEETVPALRLVGGWLAELGVRGCRWLLDSPVSNSGRLKGVMLSEASAAGWEWTVELVPSPDQLLIESAEIVATADSAILDRCQRWFNLARSVIAARIPEARVLDLSEPRP